MRVLLSLATVVIFQSLISIFSPFKGRTNGSRGCHVLGTQQVLEPDLWLLMEKQSV